LVLAALVGAFGAQPAMAADEPSSDATLSALAAHGLISLDGAIGLHEAVNSGASRSEVSGHTGLSVSTRSGTVSIVPTGVSRGTEVTSGIVTFDGGDDFDFAVTNAGATATSTAGYVILNNESAPEQYTFEIEVDGEPAQLDVIEGVVYISDSDGQAVNFLKAPWALDAMNRSVPTSYSADGDILTLEVAHVGASYPVVADPATACDWLNCTVEFTKSETHQAATSSTTAALMFTTACTLLGAEIGAFVCGAYAAWVVDTANQAEDQGKCLGIRAIHYPVGIAASPYPVVYSGGNCH